MKKFFILLAVCLFSANAFSQVEQGQIRIGGSSNLDFTNLKSKGADYSTNDFSLNVDGGYFFMDNLSADVELLFSLTKDSDEDESETSFGVGLGVRYYLPVNVFVGAGFDLISYKVWGESVTGTGVKIKAGYAAFLSDNIALEPSISYRLGLSDEEKGTQFNGLSVNIGLSVFF